MCLGLFVSYVWLVFKAIFKVVIGLVAVFADVFILKLTPIVGSLKDGASWSYRRVPAVWHT